MTGSEPVVHYSRQAAEALDKIEAAPEVHLWNAVCDALDLIIDHPESAPARRDALRTAGGTTVWRVGVRASRETEDWAVLWHYDDNGRVLVAYIGVL